MVHCVLLSHYPLSPIDVGVVPLDNLCLTDINSTRSKSQRSAIVACYYFFKILARMPIQSDTFSNKKLQRRYTKSSIRQL